VTNKQIMAMAVANPAVVQAHTKMGRDGPIPPTPQYLEGQANIAIQAVIEEILLDQAIARALLENTYTLTTASPTTEYTLPSYVSRVLNIRAGSNDELIRGFDSRDDFDVWYYAKYGDTTVVDTDAPQAWYYSGRSASHKIKITFAPAVGDETSMKIRYVRGLEEPYSVESVFPRGTHTVVLTGVYTQLTGGMFADAYARQLVKLARRLDVTIGGNRVIRHGRRARRVAARTHAMSSGSYASWPSSTKWRR
jgi:hypothetical protein